MVTCDHGKRSFIETFICKLCPRDDNIYVLLPAQVCNLHGAVCDIQHIQGADWIV